jgi:hypothetical protein
LTLYRATGRPFTVLQARHMLEPVLNLARLQLRTRDGDQALGLLTAMFRAVRSGPDLVVKDRTLPLADLTGSRAEHHKLHEWVWLHLLGDGIRALALAGRWDDAVTHANAHRRIGLHGGGDLPRDHRRVPAQSNRDHTARQVLANTPQDLVSILDG